MKLLKFQNLRIAAGVAALGICAVQSAMAANVFISINQPGVYGRVDIGEPVPQQAWVYQEPVVIAPQPYYVQRQPIYLYVPTAHSSNWGRYCSRYNACAQPVVFVQDRWVRDRHAQYQQQNEERFQHQRGHDRDHDGGRDGRDQDRDGERNSRGRQPNNQNRH